VLSVENGVQTDTTLLGAEVATKTATDARGSSTGVVSVWTVTVR